MTAVFDSKSGVLQESLHAAVPRFTAALEAEYVHANLTHNRILICASCTLGAAIAALRVLQQLYVGIRHPFHLIDLLLVMASTMLLAAVACGAAFERRYLPLASVVVPVRNMMIAAHAAHAAAIGQVELLMTLPVLVIAPFFFLGLPLRTALVSAALTIVAFVGSAAVFAPPLPVVSQSAVFMVGGLVACGIAAWQLDKHSRSAFLETRRVAELARHDALTWTKNRRVFDEELTRLWPQAVGERCGLALLLVDVDHFKAYNDRFGHQAGDQALRHVAQTVQRFVSGPNDVLARYGGEEFVAVLYGLAATQAVNTAEQIRRAVQDSQLEQSDTSVATITVSVGVAALQPLATRDPYGAVQLADQALYRAKLKGRNRVELMGEAEHDMLVTGVFASQPRTNS